MTAATIVVLPSLFLFEASIMAWPASEMAFPRVSMVLVKRSFQLDMTMIIHGKGRKVLLSELVFPIYFHSSLILPSIPFPR